MESESWWDYTPPESGVKENQEEKEEETAIPAGTPIPCQASKYGLCQNTFPFDPVHPHKAYCGPRCRRQVEYYLRRTRKPGGPTRNKAQDITLSALDDIVLLEELSRRGKKVVVEEPTRTDTEVCIDRFVKGKPIRLGVVACTHFGSIYQQLTALREFYKYCSEHRISLVLHCGDLVDGIDVYKGQQYEVYAHGFDAQKKAVVENYPYEPGVETLVIAGNHDYSFVKGGGANIVEAVACEREDIKYLGDFGAYLQMGAILVHMMHADGGQAYARSYRLQKIAEGYPPERKPHVGLVGHWHVPCHVPMCRNVEMFSIGAFQAQTPYLRRKGLWPDICGLLIELTPDERGLAKITTHWMTWYIVRTQDY